MPKQDLILAENASEELLFYEKKVLSTLCLLKCKFSQPDFVSADEFVHREQLFLHETFEAYNYLQLCYYQVRLHNNILWLMLILSIMWRNDELSSMMSWVVCLLKDPELFILLAENRQILLKISVIHILLTFIYLVALNLLVNNQLNSSSNSTHHCGI